MTILYCLKKPKSLYFQRFSDFNSFLKRFNLHVEVAEKLYFLYVLEQLFIFCLVCAGKKKSVQDIQSHTLHALLLMFYYSLALNQGMCLCCDGVAKHDPITLQGVSILATPFANARFGNPTYCT